MRKGILVATMIAVIVSFTSMAFAADSTIGFQFRVPFQVTGDKNIKDVAGQSILLTFFLDQDTEVGVLSESINLTDKTGGANCVTDYTVTALRISKNIMSPVYVGLDLGNININGTGTANGATTMADIFGGVRLLASRGKVVSFLDVELDYRLAQMQPTGSNIKNFNGAMLNLSAGLNF